MALKKDASKRKVFQLPSAPFPPHETSKMQADEYIERTGLSAVMKDAVLLLMENRPADPILFLAKYFELLEAEQTAMQRTLHYINLAPPQRPCYMDNLFQAFTIQSNALRRTLAFADLLPLAAQLLHGLPSHVMQVVKTVVDKRGHDRCNFDQFVAVVGLCGDVRRLHDIACWIFQKCDSSGLGFIEKDLFFALLRQLQVFIPKKADGSWGSAGAAADAAANVPESMFTTRGPQQVISLRDFIATLLDVFVVRFL